MSTIWETEELARHLCGVDPDDDRIDIDDELYEKFDVNLEQFHKIVSALLPMAMVSGQTVSGETYQGFVNRERNCFLVKQPIQ
jgi:hypothetical protein